MTLFLSYAHQDLDVVTSLRRDLEDLGQSVWLDESLHGGQIWWEEILRQVRQCNGFILAVSALSLESEACLAEWQYALDLARPFLPVRIDATEWTAAPDRMRQSQHVDYKPNDADSVKALVRSLGGFAQAVPLPEPLPEPPPTPLSYHERYAKLFAPAPLTFDDQITYFARLTTDVDSANSKEAVELLTVLRNREDLTVKMGKRIDEFLVQHDMAPIGVPTARVSDADAPALPEIEAGDHDDVHPISDAQRDDRRRWIVVAAVAAAVVLAVVLAVALWPKSKEPAPPLVENTECAADNCDPPIQFLGITGDPEAITVKIIDPVGATRDADPPTPYNNALEWHWSPSSADPIGDYTVQFDGATSAPADSTFTINAVEGPFAAVQRAGDAIANGEWTQAAAIDQTIKDELDAKGEDFLNQKYPAPNSLYWVPYDTSGEHNANGTTIFGALVSYDPAVNRTTVACELWSINPDNQTMRSDPLPKSEDQVQDLLSGPPDAGGISDFVDQKCRPLVSTD